MLDCILSSYGVYLTFNSINFGFIIRYNFDMSRLSSIRSMGDKKLVCLRANELSGDNRIM